MGVDHASLRCRVLPGYEPPNSHANRKETLAGRYELLKEWGASAHGDGLQAKDHRLGVEKSL